MPRAFRWSLIAALSVAVIFGAGPAVAQEPPEVPIADVLADPEAYAAPRTPSITVQGELIGDYGRRGDGSVWVWLNDDGYAEAPLLGGGDLVGGNIGFGARIPEDLMPEAGDPGGYRRRGPLVRLSGAWRFHDPDRGGESYLDVEAVRVLAPARSIGEDPHWPALGFGVALLGAAVVVQVRFRRLDRAG